MRIQHNIAAMNAYRNYTNNTSAVSKNLEKLSSGYKINRAGDDAAGLAISEKMRAQISGLKAAQKNAKDGISLVKTAEGALQEVHDMLNRMVTLATQSANGTYDNSTDRAQLQKEVDQLKAEIDRIADSSNFNGIKLLDGSQSAEPSSFSNVSITNVRDGTTLKAAANGKYEIDLSKATWTASADGAQVKIAFAGKEATVAIAKAGGTATGAQVATALKTALLSGGAEATIDGKKFTIADDGKGKLTFTGVDTTAFATAPAANAATFKVTHTNTTNTSAPNNAYITEKAGNQGWSQAWTQLEEPVSSASSVLAQMRFDLSSVSISDGTVLKIGDTSYTFAVGKNSQYKTGANVVDLTDFEVTAMTTAKAQVAAAARLSGAANGNAAAFVEYSGAQIYITEKEGGINREDYDVIGADETQVADATWKNQNGQCFVQFGQSTGGGMKLQIGDTADTYNQLKVSVKDCHSKALGISGLNISDQASAATAISSIRNAINYVSDVRGTLGATQNRLEHTINNLSVMTENIQDAESTIRDTDIAEEMMAYTKNNILVQSAQAMLAQANQIPQGVLQLLG